MRLSPRYQLYAVGGIIATLLLAILIFNLLNRNPGASPGTGGEKAPTQNMFVAPTKGNATPAPQKANPIPTWTNVVSPTPTPIPETCVYKVQNGDSLSYIFLNMGIAYQANATYTYYTDCNVVSGTCSKPGNVAPGNHDAIQPGWYFVIDGVEKDTCVAKDGHVIKIKVKP